MHLRLADSSWKVTKEEHIELYVSQTLAFGFRVDFSEVRDPIEELGDKPGALAAEFAAMRSDADDVELPGLWEEVKGSVAEGCLTDTVKSGVSGDLNPWPEDEGSHACEMEGGPSNPAKRSTVSKHIMLKCCNLVESESIRQEGPKQFNQMNQDAALNKSEDLINLKTKVNRLVRQQRCDSHKLTSNM